VSRKRTRHFAPVRPAAFHEDAGMETETEMCLSGFLKIAEDAGIPPFTLALAYIHNRKFADIVIAGARTESQLNALVKSMDTDIPEELLTKLDACSAPLLKAVGGNPDMYRKESRVRY